MTLSAPSSSMSTATPLMLRVPLLKVTLLPMDAQSFLYSEIVSAESARLLRTNASSMRPSKPASRRFLS